MSVRSDYLAKIDLDKVRGLEFGPADRPWIPATAPGIRYIDHLTTEELRGKYAGSKVYNPEDFCTVHFVNDGRPLHKILGDWVDLDVVAASHVVEHVPNLLQWMHDVAAVLKEGGLVFLVLPNKRHEFDRMRRVTETPEVLGNFLERRTQPSYYSMLDFNMHYAQAMGGSITWVDEIDPGTLKNIYSKELCYTEALAASKSGAYKDVHVSVFSPYSLARLFYELTELGLLPFEVVDLQAHAIEIFAMLKQCQPARELPRRLAQIAELARVQAFRLDDYHSELIFRGGLEPQAVNRYRTDWLWEHIDGLERKVRDMENSTSWKVTAPLRKLSDLLKKKPK